MKRALILSIMFCFALTNHANAYVIGQTWEIGQVITLKQGYPVAASEQIFHEASNILISKDEDAFTRLVSAGVVALTNGGEQAYIVNVHIFSGLAEIRLKGDPDILWTNIEALN